jgi:cytochrome c oxidase subunit 2
MPPLVGRKRLVLCLGAVCALLLTSVAYAGNGGFGPLQPESPNAHRVEDAYWIIFGFTAAIFVLVEGTLVYCIVRYRRGRRAVTDEGLQLHGHARLVLILVAIGSFIFYKLPGISDVPAASASDRVDVRVDAHQFYWQFTYPNGQISIGDLHVPASKVVALDLHSPDVIHSFWVPQLGGKMDVVPGRRNTFWFRAKRPGTFQGRCAELCGLFHARMPIRVVSESTAAYQSYLAAAPKQLGRSEFEGVCQTCHGIGGKGGYGPALANNPLVVQRQAIANIVRNGRGRMPPVGRGWSDRQIAALVDYMKRRVAPPAGGAGGG